MRRLILTAAFLFIAVEVFCGTRIKLWKNIDNTKGRRRSELTVYLPDPDKNTGIGVIICPGGSYAYLGMKHEGHDVAKWLNENGIAAFVLRYRVAVNGNHHPAMIEDVQRAMHIVKLNSGRFRIDGEKVGVLGFSAGGHLSGMMATYYDDDYLANKGLDSDIGLKPAFAAMIYPVVSMEDPIAHRKSRRSLLPARMRTTEKLDMLSLEKNVNSEMPPLFIVACRDDKTVDYNNSVVYSRALSESGVKHKFVLYDEGGHGFGIRPKSVDNDWPAQFVVWLNDLMRENASAVFSENVNR